MAQQESKLTLGKGTAFVKSRLKRLRQDDVTWEADFQALPKPMMQTETRYLGMVVTKADGLFLADTQIVGRPTVNDLATLLAHAMRRPLAGESHQLQRIHVREHPQWRELIPHLDEIGIEVFLSPATSALGSDDSRLSQRGLLHGELKKSWNCHRDACWPS